jgi:hypothetical protein
MSRGPLAFGGGPLLGDRPVRHAYLDEAGTDEKATRLVVAGIIINLDQDWRPAQLELHRLATKWLPDRDPREVIFHVKDVMNGKKDFARYKDSDERLKILEDLSELPSKLRLPIACGFINKLAPDGAEQLTRAELLRNHYAMAFGLCLLAVEKYMREHAAPSELANVIAEDIPEVKEDAKEIQRIFSNEDEFMRRFSPIRSVMLEIPLGRVVGTVHYAAKDEEPLLQIADTCGYVLSRWLNGWKFGEQYYRVLAKDNPPRINDDTTGGHYVLTYMRNVTFAQPSWPVVSSL